MDAYRFLLNVRYILDDNIIEESVIVLANSVEEALYSVKRALHVTELILISHEQFPRNRIPPTQGDVSEDNAERTR